ncbi:YidB family protein [Guyparkeria sp. TX1]|uniref:YidB family protein n=1 Tax=Guyparkeria sp. TX1 TaxID=3115001 RepID=UPI003977D79D
MGLLDGVVGKVLGKGFGGPEGNGALLGMITQLIQDSGGLSGLLQKFQQAGLGEQVASWVGNGSNQPIDASQVSSAVGNDTLNNLASKFGIDPGQASGMLAKALPQVVDRLTPKGEVDENSQVPASGLQGMLGGLFKS